MALRCRLCLAALVLGAAVIDSSDTLSGQTPIAALLRDPTISRTHIAFSYGGDIWSVERQGGEARRLTSDVGLEIDPAFSPDGSLIALTGEYDGNEDIYLMPSTGGIPRRLTTHPSADQVVGWSNDGRRIVFRSDRNSYSRFNRLFTVSIDGGLPEEVPLPMAEQASYSPDGSRLAYVPFTNFRDSWQSARGLKHYRGGLASPVWITTLADSAIEKIPRQDSNDSTPMWIGDRIFFLSDRSGAVGLFAYDVRTKQVAQVVRSASDIKTASAGPDAIVYEQLGSIHVFDPSTGRERAVEIRVSGDFPAVRSHFVKTAEQIQTANISPTGARAIFEARGEILTVPAERGDLRNLTSSPGVMERDPAWSPDGKSIAYLSDESGEYALHLRSQDGSGDTRKISLGTPPSFYYSPIWSPDSKRIVYIDKRLNLWLVEVTTQPAPIRIDTNTYDIGPGSGFDPAWSPDSRWVVYTRQLRSGLRGVFVYSIEQKTTRQITDGLSDAAFARFDRDGRYLYFTASTDFGPVWASSMAAFRVPVTRNGYVVVLRKEDKSPLAPRTDEEAGIAADVLGCKTEEARNKPGGDVAAAAPPTVQIDFDNIDQRVLALPFPARNYSGMVAGKRNTLFLLEAPAIDEGGFAPTTIHRFDLCERKTDKLLENVAGFVLSANAEKALYEQLPSTRPAAAIQPARPHGRWFIKSIDAIGKPVEAGKPDGGLNIESMEVHVDPRAEWKQMYREVWRIQRDFFYDPNLHGANINALSEAYQPFVDRLMSRADLNYLFADMLGDITAQHVYIRGGYRPAVKQISGGLLGADYRIENNRYRFARVYYGENWNPEIRAPLTEPGVTVREGDYLLAVDGREVRGTDELFSFFQQTAGKAVQLRVAADPDGAGARTVTVVPIPNERSLRLRAWMDANRRKVDELSGGRLAYVYLPDTAAAGFTNFNRYYFAQSDKQGAIIDERFNGGGWVADYIVDWLRRPLLAAAMNREGRDNYIPQAIFGPKVMLINEYAGSGGDALPWMFKRLGTGPLIGTRTWGGLIGIGGYPVLMDGGTVTAPRWGVYNPDTGEFDVENKGIAPDIEVELDPRAWRQGSDPQLEKGIAVALDELKQHPVREIKRPKFPVYDWPAQRKSGR
jgi:tricorn protease